LVRVVVVNAALVTIAFVKAAVATTAPFIVARCCIAAAACSAAIRAACPAASNSAAPTNILGAPGVPTKEGKLSSVVNPAVIKCARNGAVPHRTTEFPTNLARIGIGPSPQGRDALSRWTAFFVG